MEERKITLEEVKAWEKAMKDIYHKDNMITYTSLAKQEKAIQDTACALAVLGYISIQADKDNVFIPWHVNNYYPDKTIDALKVKLSNISLDIKDFNKIEKRLISLEKKINLIMRALNIEGEEE